MNKQMILSQLDRSYRKLLDALEIPSSDPLAIDGTIHRFEFTYEIACETVNQFFKENLLSMRSGNGLKDALSQGLIDNRETWRKLMTLKNQTAFSFSEPLAREIYDNIRKNHYVFDVLIDNCRRMSVRNAPAEKRPGWISRANARTI